MTNTESRTASTAHTPGPWHLGADEPLYTGGRDYLYSLHVYAAPRSPDDNDTEIAWVCCRDDSSQEGVDAPRLSTARANACLIAAAPDMLARLQDARNFFESHMDALFGAGHDIPMAAGANIMISALDAAISKATGR